MKVKIISDGTPAGTRLINMETGEPIMGITKIVFSVDKDNMAKVSVDFTGIPIEAVATVVPRPTPRPADAPPLTERGAEPEQLSVNEHSPRPIAGG